MKAQAFGHPSDETERDDAEDGFDLEEELAAIDKIDEEELGLDDDEEAPEDSSSFDLQSLCLQWRVRLQFDL